MAIDSKKVKLSKSSFPLFGFWEWMPSIGREVGIPRGILPHVQIGLTNWKSRFGCVKEGSYDQFYPNTS